MRVAGAEDGGRDGVICKYLLAAKAVDCLHMSSALQLKLHTSSEVNSKSCQAREGILIMETIERV